MPRQENSVLMSLRELQQIERDRIDEEERAARRAIELRAKAERDKQRALENQRKKQEQTLRELEAKARAEAEARARVEAEARIAEKRMEIELARATAAPEPLPTPVIPTPARSRMAWIVSAILSIALLAQGAFLMSMMSDNDDLADRVTELRTALAMVPSDADPAAPFADPPASPMEPPATATSEPDATTSKPNKPSEPNNTTRPPRDDEPKVDHRITDKCKGSTDPFCGMHD